MDSPAGGTLLYISNPPSYKPRNDLYIYKSAELDSTLIESKEKKCGCGLYLLSSLYGLKWI